MEQTNKTRTESIQLVWLIVYLVAKFLFLHIRIGFILGTNKLRKITLNFFWEKNIYIHRMESCWTYHFDEPPFDLAIPIGSKFKFWRSRIYSLLVDLAILFIVSELTHLRVEYYKTILAFANQSPEVYLSMTHDYFDLFTPNILKKQKTFVAFTFVGSHL